MSLQNKKIVLGITGSIAAYKAAILVRGLVKNGADVRVVMTPDATQFITPLTIGTLSKNPVVSSYVQDHDQGIWNNHVELGMWGDLILIAPCSANTLGKMVQGICDNVLMATYLSAKCPVMVAPAMDLDMYRHPSTQANLNLLRSRGNEIIESESGELASGLEGQGRLSEPEHIIDELESFFQTANSLDGQRYLVTAGPTYESLDPVRFIGNHSSGKMGIAIASEVAKRGGKVDLVLGPSGIEVNHPNITIHHVQSAVEMHNTATKLYGDCHVGIMAAAVSDYRPKDISDEKIKKSDDSITLELTKNPDIAESLGAKKRSDQKLIGFAMETENLLENAKKKLVKKNFDLIVLNSLKTEGAGFKHDTNVVTFIGQNKTREFELKQKTEIAKDLVDEIISL
ncbi:MAG: bifunctional phosphopantothenoylcysteine decarboxylase/phosphopantothenate--cysteine ligase CoaBC [Salibacter sp.]|uniref:bifunctional phosphopantothenoylcysteine decarboxylase/phosphopantothenate--cysteine ligase CoaBC n=1 Tax=Salibacter sp. TaxID=2010995 RepID=UPI00286FDC18|nr:bifunctional phosphopantothenoylcysteine decarboxylase/phosphopantothenate--cysteine ligase CoaBC [Salibacter sp.]MDR9398373.1 bifunctional phosphopantothenoylcysteine decarboxylase/phosphopantothenate--cysteine ligase CoaBC [Salibacter sp.]